VAGTLGQSLTAAAGVRHMARKTQPVEAQHVKATDGSAAHHASTAHASVPVDAAGSKHSWISDLHKQQHMQQQTLAASHRSHVQLVSCEMPQVPLLHCALASPVAFAVQLASQMLPCTLLVQLALQASVRFCAGGKPGQVLTAI
jgi:hypothetical protein